MKRFLSMFFVSSVVSFVVMVAASCNAVRPIDNSEKASYKSDSYTP